MSQTICISLSPQTIVPPPLQTLNLMENTIESQYQNISRAADLLIERIQQTSVNPSEVAAEMFYSLERHHLGRWHDHSVRLDFEEMFEPYSLSQGQITQEDVLDALKPLLWCIDLVGLDETALWHNVSESLHQTLELASASDQLHQFEHFTIMVCQDPDDTGTHYDGLWQRLLRLAALPCAVRQITGIVLGAQPEAS